MNILITAGGTSEPIDAVRVLTNISTGRTGMTLADAFTRAGHHVTLLLAASAPDVPGAHRFTTVGDLGEKLQHLLGAHDYAMVIHAAAVSDYTLASLTLDGREYAPDTIVKRPTAEVMELKLVRAPKLIHSVKGWSRNPHVLLVGFKLTRADADARAAVDKLLRHADAVLHNDAAQITADAHPFTLYTQVSHTSGQTKQDMAAALLNLLETHHAARA